MLSPSIERQRNDEGFFFKKMKKIKNTAKIPRVKHLKVVRQNKTSTVVLVCQLTVYQVDRSKRGFA